MRKIDKRSPGRVKIHIVPHNCAAIAHEEMIDDEKEKGNTVRSYTTERNDNVPRFVMLCAEQTEAIDSV